MITNFSSKRKKASSILKVKKIRRPKAKMYSNRIKEILKEIGMSQIELADRVGTTKSHINVIIKGERLSLSLPVGMKIAQVLGRQVEDVFTLEKKS